ncbi:hypothetical protein TA3x_002233 [Tundrisphaera sp. TA3]|uniref:hypothetical protein n=1 Tax=Tundrisphaera sp. TA3 TaxID=3435775 RepID=UPI003EBD1129
MISTRHLGRFASLCSLGLSMALLSGCEPAAPVAPAPTTTEGPASTEIKSMPVEPKADGKAEGAAADVKLSDEEIAEIKKLPAEDQAIALAQKVCPVSGGHLGDPGMGAPIKQVVNGKTFFLCCSGCEGEVKSDPAGVLAKLPK